MKYVLLSSSGPTFITPSLLTSSQIRCLTFIQAVLDKPEWRRKLSVPEIVSKWRAEAETYELRPEVFDYAIQELGWLANAGDDTVGIEPTGVDFVWVSNWGSPHIPKVYLGSVSAQIRLCPMASS